MEREFLEFDSIDSTNKYLKEHYKELHSEATCSALFQTQGRGRYDRSFVANKGDGATFSILLKDEFCFKNFELLSLMAGAVVCSYLENMGFKSSIKWPNDVYIGDKKVCGILLESVSLDKLVALIVGIGLNVNQQSFPSELPDATSMFMNCKIELDVRMITHQIVNLFFECLNAFKRGDNSFIEYVKKHNYLKNKEVFARVFDKDEILFVEDISELGYLICKEKEGTIKELKSGEVTFHKNK
ncbi:MAG: biotin--[acetyl-CoA-carboxylase] ligase [Erysipelotrichaceae bacterium]|nr:biotin--[acetyl-CoA-carboxylase] ligase [Erysipelotrichaceae bacterium]MCB9500053.1 biotin--[acetyl-CoA-carboxylase] ligase [Erysipelotrichaceae bacterium]